jgi:hypothetical protein
MSTIVTHAQRGTSEPAFLEYSSLFIAFLEGHHLNEDRFVFPALRAGAAGRGGDMAFLDTFGREHGDVHRLIGLMRAAIEDAKRTPAAIQQLSRLGQELTELLMPHLAAEEAVLTAQRLREMISADALARAFHDLREHDRRQGPGAAVFFATSMNAEEQRLLLGDAPWFFRRVQLGILWQGMIRRLRPYLFNPTLAI